MGRPPRLSVVQKLQRFSPSEWARPISVGLSNADVHALVTAGWLDRRIVPMFINRGGRVPVVEYRLTRPGSALLAEVKP